MIYGFACIYQLFIVKKSKYSINGRKMLKTANFAGTLGTRNPNSGTAPKELNPYNVFEYTKPKL